MTRLTPCVLFTAICATATASPSPTQQAGAIRVAPTKTKQAIKPMQATFHAIPRLHRKSADEIKMRIIRYDGSTNGVMYVALRNTGTKAATFDATGLYFIPQMKASTAPQRLGAAGPYEVKVGSKWQPARQTVIKPGKTIEARLSLFCIDSHRASPSSRTRFAVAKKRMPKKLRRAIQFSAADAVQGEASPFSGSAKGKIQRRVWKTRDKKWIRLEGEAAKDANGKGQ